LGTLARATNSSRVGDRSTRRSPHRHPASTAIGSIGTNDSAVAVLGDDTLRTIARDLAEAVKKNASIDWEQKETVRAEMRVAVKRILRKHGYPPDKQERATALVIEQAEQLGLDIQAI
jgi:hypothetical protein